MLNRSAPPPQQQPQQQPSAQNSAKPVPVCTTCCYHRPVVSRAIGVCERFKVDAEDARVDVESCGPFARMHKHVDSARSWQLLPAPPPPLLFTRRDVIDFLHVATAVSSGMAALMLAAAVYMGSAAAV